MSDPQALLAATRAFVDDVVLPGVAAWDRADALPDDVWERLDALGLHGALVGSEHGGPGLSVADLVPVWRTLSQGWISLTGAVNPSGLAVTLLQRHATDAQRARWRRRVGVLPLRAPPRPAPRCSAASPAAVPRRCSTRWTSAA